MAVARCSQAGRTAARAAPRLASVAGQAPCALQRGRSGCVAAKGRSARAPPQPPHFRMQACGRAHAPRHHRSRSAAHDTARHAAASGRRRRRRRAAQPTGPQLPPLVVQQHSRRPEPRGDPSRAPPRAAATPGASARWRRPERVRRRPEVAHCQHGHNMATTAGGLLCPLRDSHAGRRHVSWGGDARRRGAASPCAGTRAQSRRSWDSDACRPTLHDAVRLGGALLSPCQPALGCSRRGDATRAAARSAARAQRVRSRARHAAQRRRRGTWRAFRRIFGATV